MSAFHHEQFTVAQNPTTVAGFILDPDRVMQYFPGAISAGRFDGGDAIWVRARTGTTLIEQLSPKDDLSLVTVCVTSTQLKDDPPNRATLQQSPLMRFYEDWRLEESDAGTRISKTWRDLEASGFMRFMPTKWLVKRTGRSGVELVADRWSSPL